MASKFTLIIIENDPLRAFSAALAGIDTIMVDLEKLGKPERQAGVNSFISSHHLSDIAAVSDAINNTKASVLVRTDPYSLDMHYQIDAAIDMGATQLMLPMFRSAATVRDFLEYVSGRLQVILLVETVTALARLPEILSTDYDFSLHLGLNDLHLECKLTSMFEVVTGGLAEYFATCCQRHSRTFGIGGVGRLNSNLRVPAELILLQHLRLGSSSVLLSRDWKGAYHDNSLAREVIQLKELMQKKVFDYKTNELFDIVSSISG